MLGKRLKQLRTSANLTQKQLADKMNIASSTVSMYEAGRRDPDTDTLKKLSSIFNVSIDYLTGNQESTTPLTQEHLTNTYDRIKDELGEDVQVLFHDITAFDEEEMDKLKFAIEMIKRDKKKKTP